MNSKLKQTSDLEASVYRLDFLLEESAIFNCKINRCIQINDYYL